MQLHPSAGIYFTLAGVEHEGLLCATLPGQKILELLKRSQGK